MAFERIPCLSSVTPASPPRRSIVICPLNALPPRCAMADDMADILAPTASAAILTADAAANGLKIPPHQQILLSPDAQWEDFVQEWAHYCLKSQYVQVQRFSGSGDRGIDIAGFADANKLAGVWDNYQCKHYDHALYPSDAWPEIAKVLWYTFNNQFAVPRRYFFVAPRGAGTTLAGYLANANALKTALIDAWDKNCRTNITSTQDVLLTGGFLAYVNAFDFRIFDSKTTLQLIEDHKNCPCHAARFGGGLPARPEPAPPPSEVAPVESRYVEQLLGAYADHTKQSIASAEGLKPWPKLKEHFLRQRVAFYHAESLRVFARDSVPTGTFESLQQDIYSGIIDTHDAEHPDGYVRVCAVTKAAREMQITANALITRAKPQDRDGICHQLANEDRLQWTKP